MFFTKENKIIEKCLKKIFNDFSDTDKFINLNVDESVLEETLLKVSEKLIDNYPYFHPLYAGHMLKPPHPIARIAYYLTMHINPNNHAIEGGIASTKMEKEAVIQLGNMVGWQKPLGHLCSGGTIGNLEAIWVGREKNYQQLFASSQAHYTHKRMASILNIPFQSIPVDSKVRMDVDFLESCLKKSPKSTIVATLGTTLFGSVDPIYDILELKKKYDFRLHLDAAYGGFFILCEEGLSPETKKNFSAVSSVDSIVIDPHKHGLQPYGCGSILFKNEDVGETYQHHSPYTYFDPNDLHLGQISLECSRPGASAVALWATMQLFPFKKGGILSKELSASLKAAKKLYEYLKDSEFYTPFYPELDIVIFVPKTKEVASISALSEKIFSQLAKENLHIALAKLPVGVITDNLQIKSSLPFITCLRTCLMKPNHLDHIDDIFYILEKVAKKIL